MEVDVGQVFYWVVRKHGGPAWCLVERLPEKLVYPNIPKHTDEEAVAFAEARLDKVIVAGTTTNAPVTFRQFWEKRKITALVNVEEGLLPTWTSENIVLVGDIVHKVLGP